MFKKGVITDEISQDMGQAVELASRYGLDGVEIRSVWEKGPHELDKNDIMNIKKQVADANLEVCGISAPFFKCNIDNVEELDQHIKILQKSIELATSLNAKIIRGFTFWKNGGFDENLSKIISRFEKPLRMLEGTGITLALEFDPSVFASNARTLVQVVKGIGVPYVKALWDPGNDIYDPEGEKPYPDGFSIIKPYMVHMHLKDAHKVNGKPIATPVGEGEVDYEGHFREIIKDGYSGYVVLETHYRPKHEMSEELLALPKGSSFSYLGYEASEDSLIKWNALLDRISK